MPPVYRNEEDERRIDAAIKNGSEQAEWTKIMEENWRLVSGELFFGNRSGEFLSRLSTKSMYRTIGRPVTDGCYGRLFMLSQGCSMADTLDPGKAAEYQNAGEAAIRFLQENPVNREMSYDEKKRASAVHGKMFHEAASQLMNEEFPDINWKDPVAVAGIFRYVSALSDMAINFVQIKQDITHEDGFIEAYGSQHALDDMDYKIGNMGWFAQEAERAYNAAIPVNERFAGRAALNHFAPVFSGKKVSELPNDLDLGAKIQRYSMEAKMWYSQAQPEERQKMEAYLNGTGPEPPYILEQFARAAEEEGILHHRSEDRKITDEELGGREHGSVTMLRLFHDNPAQPSRYFRLRQQRGNLRVNDDTPQKERQEKEELIREGSLCFEVLSRQMNLNVNHPLYENAGYHYPEELFFIDGIPATEYIKQRYPDMSIKGNVADRKLFQAEVISAVLSGEHHVEVAQMGIGKNGAYEVSVQEVRADTKIMDGQERFYQTRPSKKLESFYRDDKNRDQRLAGIRTQVSEKLAMAAGNIINRKEAEKEPYAAAAKKFSLGSAELNRQYFDWRSLERLKEIPGKASAELPRGDFGGYRTYAQMLLLAEHPEIRFADLMNPDKFINEKRRAGERVAHAFHSLYMEMDPNNPDDKTYLQPAVEIMKTSMKAIGEMDLRKELLYALGEPEDLPEEAVREIISKPENHQQAGKSADG